MGLGRPPSCPGRPHARLLPTDTARCAPAPLLRTANHPVQAHRLRARGPRPTRPAPRPPTLVTRTPAPRPPTLVTHSCSAPPHPRHTRPCSAPPHPSTPQGVPGASTGASTATDLVPTDALFAAGRPGASSVALRCTDGEDLLGGMQRVVLLPSAHTVATQVGGGSGGKGGARAGWAACLLVWASAATRGPAPAGLWTHLPACTMPSPLPCLQAVGESGGEAPSVCFSVDAGVFQPACVSSKGGLDLRNVQNRVVIVS